MFSYLIIIITYFTLTKCQINDTIIRQNRIILSSFDEILIDGAFDVYLSQSLNKTLKSIVEIQTTVDLQHNVIVEILNNHILSIRLLNSLKLTENIYVYIRFQSPLHRYTIKGSGNTLSDDNGISNENNDRFILDNRGVANVALGLNVSIFEVYFTGTGNSRFWGEVRQQTILDAKGIGDINGFRLSSKQTIVRAMGVSIIRVTATDDLQIDVTGVSSVFYRLPIGKQPSKSITSGLGKIIPIA